jgi:hypothetical protein
MKRGPKDYRIPWGHNAVCDVCGFKFKGHELRKRWDNLMCCPADWEQRHPQDFVRGIIDKQVPPYIRDQVEPVYIVPAPTDGSNL